MVGFDYNTRRAVTLKRIQELEKRIEKLSGHDKELALEVAGRLKDGKNRTGRIAREFYANPDKKPSEWFGQKGLLPGSKVHKALLNAFVPSEYQESFLYIIDKLNQFPFSYGWYRRTVRTAGYGPQMHLVFSLLMTYEKLFYCGTSLENLIYRRLDAEKMDYVKHEWNFNRNFSLIYAAEIDRGNQAVIQALENLILSEQNTAYLDREMILGIFQSDNRKLHKLTGDLLVAARLQEGLRQAVCETMDEGTKDAFLTLFEVIENHNLIRYSSVQRAVSAWTGISYGAAADRMSRKLLQMTGRCLRDRQYCQEQLKTDDAVAVSTALWALGFDEAQDAVAAMMELTDNGSRSQKLAASYYNEHLFDESLKIRTARKVILEHTDDLELVAAYMPAFHTRCMEHVQKLLYPDFLYPMEIARPKKAVLTDYFTDREDALIQYEKLYSIYEQLPKKGAVYEPCIFPWHRVELKPSEIICQLAFTAYVLADEEKITQTAALLGGVSAGSYARGFLLNLLLYQPSNQKQRELLIQYMGNAEGFTSSKAAALAEKLEFTVSDYRLMEDMLRLKRSRLRSHLLKFLAEQDDACMEECLKRLLTDKKEEKRSAGLDLLMRLSEKEERADFYERVRPLAGLIQKPSDKEKILIEKFVIEESGMEKSVMGKSVAEKYVAGKSVIEEFAAEKLLMEESMIEKSVTGKAQIEQASVSTEEYPAEKFQPGRKENLPLSQQKGFGIYDPDILPEIPLFDEGTEAVQALLPLPEKEIIDKIKKLDAFIRKNRDFEYTAAFGEKTLLGNAYTQLKESGKRGNAGQEGRQLHQTYCLENYPLAQELRDFYQNEIGGYGTFIEWEARLLLHNTQTYQGAKVFYEAVFGKMPFQPLEMELEYERQIQNVRLNYRYEFLDRKLLFQAGLQGARAMAQVISPKNKMVPFYYHGWNGMQNTSWTPAGSLCFLSRLLEGLAYWETDEEFTKAFYTAWKLELAGSRPGQDSRFLADSAAYRGIGDRKLTPLTPYWFLKAYHLGLISEDILYQAILDYFNRSDNLTALTQLVKGEYANPFNRSLWRKFFGEETGQAVSERGAALAGKDTWCGRLVQKLYDTIVPLMTDTELRRSEAETVFSKDISGITYIQGTAYLVRILKALGNDALGREVYYSWYHSSGTAKPEVLSRLLKACYPAAGDNVQALREALEGTDIRTQRLVETAMYAPQWIDLIEQYLGWKGLKSGCYYFMAHMNERFDDAKMAVIARYTPLSAEELQDGAFDIEWFREAYSLLGEHNFGILYKAAKYISDGQKHSRARKYADAASGKVTLENLRARIIDKRNKDLLMSYGLVPFAADRERDLMERYQFIRNFEKESRQFGAQRRASEGKAVQTALVNLSVHAGYADVTRLILNMEGRLAEEFAPLMKWVRVEDTDVCLHVDEAGKSEILCKKDGKTLKSLPVKVRKHPQVLEMKNACRKLKEQYARAKKMLEESMEDGAEFMAEEAEGLMKNPAAGAVLRTLVFVCGDETGFFVSEGESGTVLKEEGSEDSDTIGAENISENHAAGNRSLYLQTLNHKKVHLYQGQKLRIAHPLDLYRAGVWHAYQKYLFEQQIRQPFRQVFRELYVKLPEERGLKASRMFAGNQIQPKKTAACLKGRRWIADYEEGLQKIFYKENIIAKIYALADWFSPSDIEAPTLEWVEFSDRRTFEPLTIEQVPDLIYSEVMRDVDLAVSVAHAGGVDPQTSHSTIEMRRAIVEFNLPLFGLDNVVLKDAHAVITGTRGNYNVHLGSGVVHQEGGAMLNILPVHSQRRGKLFLPFVDEDPKTAEIMSKIVLLAEDKKIRDPFILEQIRE